jgi:hypothetical protein
MMRVLDLGTGTGTGRLARALAAHGAELLDPVAAPSQVAAARALAHGRHHRLPSAMGARPHACGLCADRLRRLRP